VIEPKEPVGETVILEADGKSPDTRHPKPGTRPRGGESKQSADKSRGMRLTYQYAAVTCPVESATPSRKARIQQGGDEYNAVDGGFPTAS